MTREDIDNIISVICPNDEDFEKACISPAYLKKELETLALEQEPCKDTISRQAAIDAIKKLHSIETEYDCTLYEKLDVLYELEDLPSVMPTEKQEPCENPHIYECSCGYGWDKDKVVRHHFCPNCGRKVQEVEE